MHKYALQNCANKCKPRGSPFEKYKRDNVCRMLNIRNADVLLPRAANNVGKSLAKPLLFKSICNINSNTVP